MSRRKVSMMMAASLRAALEADGISQAEFAREVGASAKHVNQVLNGTATTPIATLEFWAFALGRRWQVDLVSDEDDAGA